MVGALVPMVPEGLVLMTSIAFAVGVVRLGRRQCLVQELPGDRGPRPRRRGVRRQDRHADRERHARQRGRARSTTPDVGRRAGASWPPTTPGPTPACRRSPRPTGCRRAGPRPPRAPFKSATKWSGTSYGEHGNWVIGAPDVLLDPASPVAEQAERIGAQGLRVLLLGSSDVAVDDPDAPGTVTPAALVVLEQRVRPDARDTLDYFAAQQRLGQGDLRRQRGLGRRGGRLPRPDRARRWTRASCRPSPTRLADALEEYTTFGRVRPDQKRSMVHALQSRGHTVAMTGDGVNDVLALKDADIGVAMGSGSSASRAVAQIVLLDNKFATLPYVVGEGRRVIGNIERVSNLFLTKTVYSVLLAVLVGLAGLSAKIFGTDPLLFPFQPIHVTIAAWFTIGVPAFILSLAPNDERAHSGFVRRVMTSALPSGLVVGTATFVSYLLAYQGRAATEVEQTQASTAALITLLISALWVLAVVARPYEWWRVALVAVSALAYVVIFSLPVRARAVHARSVERRDDVDRARDRGARRGRRRGDLVGAGRRSGRNPQAVAFAGPVKTGAWNSGHPPPPRSPAGRHHQDPRCNDGSLLHDRSAQSATGHSPSSEVVSMMRPSATHAAP